MSDIPGIQRNVPIPTWFGVGGGADRFCRARDRRELQNCLDVDADLRVLGDGANLLVDDAGVAELVVALDGPEFTKAQIDAKTGIVLAGAGAKLPALINKTVDQGLAGLETLAGFPATIGGAVVMNAGGKYGELADHLVRVFATDRRGGEHIIERREIEFSYRHSGLNELIVTAAQFQLAPDDPAVLKARKLEVMEYKKKTQPLADNSAGCCFKNPTLAIGLKVPDPARGFAEFAPGTRISAGMLIDRAGCKGLRIGSASVSPQHGNFLTADKGGRAGDVIKVMEEVTRRVLERFGVRIEPEVVIWRRQSSPQRHREHRET